MDFKFFVKTKLGWFFIASLLSVIFMILSQYYIWAEYGFYISMIYPVLLAVSFLIYGVINSIKDQVKKKKR